MVGGSQGPQSHSHSPESLEHVNYDDWSAFLQVFCKAKWKAHWLGEVGPVYRDGKIVGFPQDCRNTMSLLPTLLSRGQSAPHPFQSNPTTGLPGPEDGLVWDTGSGLSGSQVMKAGKATVCQALC